MAIIFFSYKSLLYKSTQGNYSIRQCYWLIFVLDYSKVLYLVRHNLLRDRSNVTLTILQSLSLILMSGNILNMLKIQTCSIWSTTRISPRSLLLFCTHRNLSSEVQVYVDENIRSFVKHIDLEIENTHFQ